MPRLSLPVPRPFAAFLFALWAILCAAGPAAAQPVSYPQPLDVYLTDPAGAVGAETAARLRADLAALRAETGVHMTVAVLPDLTGYIGDMDVRTFAEGLFNAWGIGDAARNDGILALIVTGPREMRVVLGRGYDQGYDVTAQDIVSKEFLPALRAGSLDTALLQGAAAVADRIARRHAAALPAPEAPKPDLIARFLPWILGIALAFAIGRQALRSRRTPVAGTAGAATSADRHEGRHDRRDREAVRSERGDRDFGGGDSSGGGAGGKW